MLGNLAYQMQPKRQQQYQQQTKPQVKVKKKRQITVGEKLLFSLLLVFSTIGCTMIIVNQATIFQYNNDIQQLEESIADQEKINGGLKQDIKELSRPERILKIAREQGLTIQNNNVQIIGH